MKVEDEMSKKPKVQKAMGKEAEKQEEVTNRDKN
jgi:hypothetical protein